METSDGQRGRDNGGQRRSTLDVIMNQIRRKRTASDRKPLGRFLSRSTEQPGIPEDAEVKGHSSGVCAAAESEQDAGWGRVGLFLRRLGKNGDGTRLSLVHGDLTATDLLELATLLPFLPELEELDLSWNDLIGGCVRALTSHLHHVSGLKVLKLCSCRLSPDDITAVGESLSSLPALQILDLSWNPSVGGGASQQLLPHLQPALTELHLVACQLTAADADALGTASALRRLCVLDLSYNPQLSQEVGVFQRLAASLHHTPSLTVLRLRACGLMPDSLEALGPSLRCLSSLRHLDLSANKTLAGGLNRVTCDLTHLTRLESLDLHLCCLTPPDLEALIQVLPSLPMLTELDVSSNQEVGGVVNELVSALPLTQMRRLPLSCCGLTHQSVAALALATPHLHSVDVSWCKEVGGRLELLLDALQPSVILELHLSSCDLTAGDLRHLALACKRGSLSSLQTLNLSYNGSAGADGWSDLLAAAAGGGLSSLVDVDLSLRPLTSAAGSSWFPSLLAALPQLPALSRLAARGWTLGDGDRQRLTRCLGTRSILLELEEQSPWKPSIQEKSGPEE